MSKTMCFAGVSRVAGELKFRGANDVKRIDQLRKLGDTDVELVYLDGPMTKVEAANELLHRGFDQGRADVRALLANIAFDTPEPVTRRERTVRVKSVKVKTVKEPKISVDEANARVLATVREMDPARELELRVFKMIKRRRNRTKETV